MKEKFRIALWFCIMAAFGLFFGVLFIGSTMENVAFLDGRRLDLANYNDVVQLFANKNARKYTTFAGGYLPGWHWSLTVPALFTMVFGLLGVYLSQRPRAGL
jgi:hypothetical protein